jgi:hypothetical protein
MHNDQEQSMISHMWPMFAYVSTPMWVVRMRVHGKISTFEGRENSGFQSNSNMRIKAHSFNNMHTNNFQEYFFLNSVKMSVFR